MHSRGRWPGKSWNKERQPSVAAPHPIVMRIRLIAVACIGLTLAALSACTSNESPDEIRDKTARDTAALKRDTKAVAEGIKDGLTEKKSVDLNKASKDELAGLPGMDDHKADRVIAERPYASSHQLVTRHVLTEDEYSRIQDQVVVAH
jgi:DNA uptake protein ComE-like DNA-binding protein